VIYGNRFIRDYNESLLRWQIAIKANSVLCLQMNNTAIKVSGLLLDGEYNGYFITNYVLQNVFIVSVSVHYHFRFLIFIYKRIHKFFHGNYFRYPVSIFARKRETVFKFSLVCIG